MKQKKTRKQSYLTALTLIIFFVTLFVSINYATKGSELTDIEKKAKVLEAENRELSTAFVAEMSLTKISEKVGELSMIKPEKIVYLQREMSLAKLPN